MNPTDNDVAVRAEVTPGDGEINLYEQLIAFVSLSPEERIRQATRIEQQPMESTPELPPVAQVPPATRTDKATQLTSERSTEEHELPSTQLKWAVKLSLDSTDEHSRFEPLGTQPRAASAAS